jgi:hypothetical protein
MTYEVYLDGHKHWPQAHTPHADRGDFGAARSFARFRANEEGAPVDKYRIEHSQDGDRRTLACTIRPEAQVLRGGAHL